MDREHHILNRWSLTLWAVMCLVAAVLITAPGCSGCKKKDKDKQAAKDKKDDGTEKDKKKEKPKRDFDVEQLKLQPTDDTVAQLYVKPGHYVAATQEIIANNFPFSADLHTASVDKAGNPMPVSNTRFAIEATRPAPLPKGTIKYLEASYFIPRATSQTVWLKSELRSKSGRRMVTRIRPTLRMPGHQFRFVVLAEEPDRYAYLKAMDAIDAPARDFENAALKLLFYRVLLPKTEDNVPLPSDSFSWTSIAYVLWDKVDGERLSSRQRQSLIDWLHFGGQLIISGPDTLEDLQAQGGFLADLLPAKAGKSVPVTKEALEDLNSEWAVTVKKQKHELGPLPDIAAAPLMIELEANDGARFVPTTGKLVAERAVGRGRIIVTAFPLSERWVTNWRGFDQFMHCCLLRRPSRTFQDKAPQFQWRDYPRRDTPALVSNVRYFSRDLGKSAASQLRNRRGSSQNVQDDDAMRFGGYTTTADAGVAAWSDTGTVATAARQSVRDAAGINVPKAKFVFRMLAIYLIILVPVNWAFFRVIRRVEWAWVAAPLIAIGGAFAVVRLAQLDIGFARSQTELSVIEGYGGFDRGHLTRYTALYTSLSTTYDFRFENDSAVAQPFPVRLSESGGVDNTVHFRRDQQLALSGFRVESSKTGMIHSEQMYPMGGSFSLTGDMTNPQVRNGTDLELRDVGVIFRTSTGQLRTAWLGELAAHSAKVVRFGNASEPWLKNWSEIPELISLDRHLRVVMKEVDRNNDRQVSEAEAKNDPTVSDSFSSWDENDDNVLDEAELRRGLRRERAGTVRLGSLLDLATKVLTVRRGEMRLVGWTDKTLKGMEVIPSCAQVESKTLVLMHLNPIPYPAPERDVNVAANVITEDGSFQLFDGSEPLNNPLIPGFRPGPPRGGTRKR